MGTLAFKFCKEACAKDAELVEAPEVSQLVEVQTDDDDEEDDEDYVASCRDEGDEEGEEEEEEEEDEVIEQGTC